MNLQGTFFRVFSIKAEGNSARATIELNPQHEIFEGHFPGMPVVPGVCMMQMVKEIVERITGSETLLSKSDIMKFLVVINPLENKIIEVDMKYNTDVNGAFEVTAAILVNTTVCFKFKGLFIPE